jgi:succinoglycan biosynthesis transport protein ExoP
LRDHLRRFDEISTTARHSIHEAGSDSGLSIGDIFGMLWLHKWFIAACVLLCTICSALYITFKTPLYQASATLRIDPARAGSLGLGDLAAVPLENSDMIKTEIAIIKSDAVAIRALNSLSDEQFTSYTGLGNGSRPIPQDSDAISPKQQKAIDQLELQTEAKQIDGTQLVGITFRDKDPKVAAQMVNHLVREYAVQNFASRDESVSQLRTWLTAQMATLQSQVDDSQKKLAQFQESHNIIGTNGTSNTITDRLRFLNDRLASAQAERIMKEAQLRAARQGDPGALASLFPNPRLQSLQGQQGALFTQYAQLSAKFGPRYGPLAELKKQMAAVDAEIADDVQSVRKQLTQEYDAANHAQNMLQAEYDQQTQAAYALNRSEAEYAALQSEVNSSRELYDTLRRKLQQASIDAEVNGVNTMSVESARVPSKPVEPKKMLVMVSGVIIGLFAGIASAFFVERSSGKPRTIDQIEEQAGYDILATIPRDRSWRLNNGYAKSSIGRSSVRSLVTLREPRSRAAEAYRSLRNSILLSSHKHAVRTLLITSALPGEGVDETAANYAITLAQTGFRVLLIDTDLGQPSLHRQFDVENHKGLSDHLLGATLTEVYSQPVETIKTLYLLTAGNKAVPPAESLASGRFRFALKRWESDFDFVVLKSAPLLSVSDSLPLAIWVDAVLLVVCYNSTHLRALSKVHNMLSRTDARVIGVLVNDAPRTAEQYDMEEPYEEASYA